MAHQCNRVLRPGQREVAIWQLRNKEVRPHLEDKVNNGDAKAKAMAQAICQPRGQSR